MDQPAEDRPDWGTPDWGTPEAAPSAAVDLFTAVTVVVVERGGFLSDAGYDLITADGVALGSLVKQTTAAGWFFGGAASTTYQLLDDAGALVGALTRPGTIGSRSRFVVTDAVERPIGTVEQENALWAPRFLITTADGLLLRLIGGKMGSREWRLVDGLDESVLMGQVSQEFAGIGATLGGRQRFAVKLSPQLDGADRLLALLATVCLDYVKDAKRKNDRAGGGNSSPAGGTFGM